MKPYGDDLIRAMTDDHPALADIRDFMLYPFGEGDRKMMETVARREAYQFARRLSEETAIPVDTLLYRIRTAREGDDVVGPRYGWRKGKRKVET